MTKLHANADYEKIRQNLYTMLDDALDALEFAKEILRESEHPRAVEVYSGLLKNVATINSQILELSKTYKDIVERKSHKESAPEQIGEKPQTTNNVFIGSTTDLQKMLVDANKIVDVTPNE